MKKFVSALMSLALAFVLFVPVKADSQTVSDATALQEAITNATGGSVEITLGDSFDITSPISIPENTTVTIDGADKTLTLVSGTGIFSNPASGTTEGVPSNVTLTFNNVNFSSNQKGVGHVVITQMNADNTTVSFKNCDLTNLYDAVYVNGATDDVQKSIYINADNSTFTDVTHFYGYTDAVASQAQGTYQTDIVKPAITNCETPLPETFAGASVGGKGYTDISAAVDAAKAGDGTITLLKPEIVADATIDGVEELTIVNHTGSSVTINDVTLPADLTMEGGEVIQPVPPQPEEPVATPEPTPSEPEAPATYDDGGPFTKDEYGNVYDRWGNEIWHNPNPIVVTPQTNSNVGFQLVNTADR